MIFEPYKFMDMLFLKAQSEHDGIWFVSAVIEGYCTVSFKYNDNNHRENLFKCATHNEAKFAIEWFECLTIQDNTISLDNLMFDSGYFSESDDSYTYSKFSIRYYHDCMICRYNMKTTIPVIIKTYICQNGNDGINYPVKWPKNILNPKTASANVAIQMVERRISKGPRKQRFPFK